MDVEPYRREDPDAQPPSLFPAYASTVRRAPLLRAIRVPQTLTEASGPANNWADIVGPPIADMTVQHNAAPIGQRIIVAGRVLDENRRPIPNTVIEIWQANAAGRYIHGKDDWNAPLDPNFTGVGRAISDEKGRYRFVSVRPGAYPWGNHPNAWRPAHIHFSLLGPAFASRLITQMYFPDDPLIDLDPIVNAVPTPYRRRLVARFDIATTQPSFALGYLFDFVLRGRDATPMENRS